MTLDQLRPGERGEIIDVTLEGSELQRLLDLGFIEGVKVWVIRNAPLRDPIDVELKGRQIALRRNEARGVEISPDAKK